MWQQGTTNRDVIELVNLATLVINTEVNRPFYRYPEDQVKVLSASSK